MNYLNNNPIIIGIDHGYGNIKTAHTCFPTGVTAHDKEPTFKNDLLIYEGGYYTIGEGHKEFAAEKMMDGDYYLLTLAAIGRELRIRHVTSARVHIAAGLPLTWVSEQKDAFRAYLLQNDSVDFTFRGADYHVEFAGADIFPQGFAAVAGNLGQFRGTNMLCDIGNGTMNVMYINERRPVLSRCYTEKFGTHQCMLAVRESVLRQFGKTLDDATIERVLRKGTADIGERYLTAIRETAAEYVAGIFRRLREHEYDPELMRLHVVGGGSCLVRNFGEYEKGRVSFYDDICATAKGYESRAVVTAVNAFFDRQERLASDPYLETREKEEAFLQRVLDTIREGLRESGADGLVSLAALLRSTEPARTPDAAPCAEEDLDAAMEFVNSL